MFECAVISYAGLAYSLFFFFKVLAKKSFRKTFNFFIIVPVLSNVFGLGLEGNGLSSVTIRAPGRAMKRREEKGDALSRKRIIRSRCGVNGHNRRTCKEVQVVPVLPDAQ